MVDVVLIKAACNDLVAGEVACELIYDRRYYLLMSKLIGSLMLDINNQKDVKPLNTLGRLEKMLMAGEITEEEYKEKKAVYVETLLELYIKDLITKDQLKEKLNQ